MDPSLVLLKISSAASVALKCAFRLSKEETEISQEAVLPLDGVQLHTIPRSQITQ